MVSGNYSISNAELLNLRMKLFGGIWQRASGCRPDYGTLP